MSTTMVHVRVDSDIKAQAANILASVGLSLSDATRLFMHSVVNERGLPLTLKQPNPSTQAAIQELDAGEGKRFSTVADLMDDLNA
jgi:DNA-damage-inducible protein J